jgi:hypothetical protein
VAIIEPANDALRGSPQAVRLSIGNDDNGAAMFKTLEDPDAQTVEAQSIADPGG